MKQEPMYLRKDIQVEPLVDQWYAWSFLIPPVQLARNITERHLKIMNSYILAPSQHAIALKNPKLIGGPFIDLNGERVADIRTLRDRTVNRSKCLVELSVALAELDSYLRASATGQSLDALYQRVPEPLKGYVELVYDLNNNPSIRLIEPLLYRSPHYDRSAQSLMLSVTLGDRRPFIMSTPRLLDDDCLQLSMPFDAPAVDCLFRLRSEPQPFDSIQGMVAVPEGSEKLFEKFFTPDKPRPFERYGGSGIRWRYFGHACVLIETSEVSLLVDPVVSYAYDCDVPRYSFADLPEHIDFVFITHGHQDHILFETLLQLRHRIGTVVVPRGGCGALQDPSLKLLLEAVGFRNVVELESFAQIQLANGSVMALPFLGEHADVDIRSKVAYLVRIGGEKILFAADSCNVEPKVYEHIHREVGDISTLFVGMECDGAPLSWLYGPLFTRPVDRKSNESRRLAGSNCRQAIDIVNRFNCKEVYVYAMGQEPWLNYVMTVHYTSESAPIVESDKLVQECRARGIYAERLFGRKEVIVGG